MGTRFDPMTTALGNLGREALDLAKDLAAATARAERAEAAIQRLEADVEELRGQRDFAMRELRAKIEAYDALGTEANRRLLRMATAEATVQRVRALAERYKAEWQDNNGGQFFSACYDDLLAALDSTDPVEATPEPGPIERDRELARAEIDMFQMWWVRDAAGNHYRTASSQTAAVVAAEDTWGGIPGPFTVEYNFEARPVHSRYFNAPPFPGTHPDVPAPGRSGEACICGTPGTGDFDGPRRDCPVHGEPPAERYCICPDCTRCGCGMWEKHHANLGEITPVPAPERSAEEPKKLCGPCRSGQHQWCSSALCGCRSDSGLPVDGEERK